LISGLYGCVVCVLGEAGIINYAGGGVVWERAAVVRVRWAIGGMGYEHEDAGRIRNGLRPDASVARGHHEIPWSGVYEGEISLS